MDLQNKSTYIEQGFRLTLLLLLLYWCLYILTPFVLLILWAVIIAVTLFPIQRFLTTNWSWKPKWAALTITLLVLLTFFVPFLNVVDAVIDEVHIISSFGQKHHWQLPPPSDSIKSWPLIGSTLFELWSEASEDLTNFLADYKEDIAKGTAWVATRIAGLGMAMLQIIVAIIIAGVMLVNSIHAERSMAKVFVKLMDEKGNHMLKVAVTTIRNVARGILGIAFVQAMLAGVGMFIAGVPGAAFLTILGLFLAIIQLGMLPVTLIVVLWAWPNMSATGATILTIYMIAVGLIDNVLKPMVLGKGADMPMVVVFLGAIGGFMAYGLIGLFVGAVVLVLAYQLFRVWIGVEISTEDPMALHHNKKATSDLPEPQ